MEDTDTESMDTNTDIEMESVFDEEKYEKEQTELRQLYPDIGFNISMSLDDLGEELSSLDKIFLEIDINCCMYDGNVRVENEVEFIVILKKEGKSFITTRDIIQKLNDIKYKKNCDHIFLEMIYRKSNTEDVFEMYFGS